MSDPRSLTARLARSGLLVALVLTGCSDNTLLPPPPSPTTPETPSTPAPIQLLRSMIVSNPTALPGAGAAARNGGSGPEYAYTSLPPATFTGSGLVVITNRRTGAKISAALVKGGYDPVPVEAVALDTLSIRVTLIGEAGTLEFYSVVPRSQPPVVVRTEPTQGKSDVPLNARLLVVFSEPLKQSTVSKTTVQLTRGQAILPGSVGTLDTAGLTVTFTPDHPLDPSVQYTLTVTRTVEDLNGEVLELPVAIPFTTEAAESPITAIYERTPPTDFLGLSSRFIFHEDNTFEMEYYGGQYGSFKYPGVAQRTGNTIILNFAMWSRAGAMFATATVSAGSLVVHFNDLMIMTDFEDGTYISVGAPIPEALPGGRIAFATWGADGTILYVSDPDGTNLHPVTKGSEPAWAPGGRQLAYVGAGGIHRIDLDGSGDVLLGPGRAPAWSPDGQQIAYVDGFGIAVMGIDGSNRRGLLDLTSPGIPAGATQLSNPRWSPDGTRLAFDVRGMNAPAVRGGVDVMVVNADGSGAHHLAQDGWSKFAPRWSPDGRRILVRTYEERDVPGTYFEVFASIDVASGVREVHYRASALLGLGGADYSPDGRFLVFSAPAPEPGGVQAGIRTLSLSTGAPRLLFRLIPGSDPAIPNGVDFPVWSRP